MKSRLIPPLFGDDMNDANTRTRYARARARLHEFIGYNGDRRIASVKAILPADKALSWLEDHCPAAPFVSCCFEDRSIQFEWDNGHGEHATALEVEFMADGTARYLFIEGGNHEEGTIDPTDYVRIAGYLGRMGIPVGDRSKR